jgi:hypothetical protein
MIIRPFLPESPQWEHKRLEGTLKRPSVVELFRPAYRRTTIVTALLLACAYGAAFGSIQQSPQITAGLPEVLRMTPSTRGQAVSSIQGMQEIGGLVGRIALAALALVIVSRRRLLRLFLIPGLVITPVVFIFAAPHSLNMFRIGIFLAGFTTVAQLTPFGEIIYRASIRCTCAALVKDLRPTSEAVCSAPLRLS